MYKDHPERTGDEVYIGHFHITNRPDDQLEQTIWESISWKSKRCGRNTKTNGELSVPPYCPVFVKQEEIKVSENGEEILACLVPGSYSQNEIVAVIFRMATLISSQYDRNEVTEFLEQHPWARKYVSNGFSEGNELREMGKKMGFKITLHVPTEKEVIIRKRHGKPQICYETNNETGRRFYFRFEETTKGAYRAISG